MTIRTLVVDDEPLAQRRLLALLRGEDDVEVVEVCSNGREAVAAVERHRPELLLLDVQMPEMSGFEVIAALPPERMPLVVFVTAFDRYALQAFEVHALDYLLKPYKPQRLQEALQRARAQLGTRKLDIARQMLEVVRQMGADREGEEAAAVALEEAPAGPAHLTRVLVRDSGRLFFVRVETVDWFESEGNYIRLHAGARTHLVRGRLSALAARLDPDRFMRIHRSTIVNIDRIKEVHPWFGGDYLVTLVDGTQLKLTRKYRSVLAQQIG